MSSHTHGSLSSTSTHNSISFLRASKSGFGGKTKAGKDKSRDKEQGKNTRQAEDVEEKDEWYIPYKGPYEPAPVTTTTGLKKRVSRDSWGDPVPGVGDGDEVDSHQGGVDERRSDQHHLHSTAQDAQQQRPRSQSYSSSQNQPNQPRSGYSSQSPKITSYINLDAAGGVGNSPVPPSSSSRHMLHAGYGAGKVDGGGGGGGDGMGRPWSAREASARGREGNDGAEAPRTLRQRSSLASLFEKKYTLLKKLSLSKLGLGASGAVEGGKESRVEEGGETVDNPGQQQSAEKRGQPPPRPPRQRPVPQSQPQHRRLSPSPPDPRSRAQHPCSTGDDRHEENEDLDQRDGSGDIMVVPRSPTKSESVSVSVYSQPSPFVPLTQLKSVPQQHQEEQKDKEWAPIVRLTPPPHPGLVDPPLRASSVSSFASNQRTMSSDSYSHSRSNSHSHSNSQSHSQHSASAPVSVPLAPVDEDDSHVESYYDMLITSSVDTPPPAIPIEPRVTTGLDERHPYAYGLTFPAGNIAQSNVSHRMAGKQKTRLSPIPQSRPSLATLRSTASSPDLRRREEIDDARVQGMEGVDVSRLRPHVREKLQSTGGRGKERWLSTDLIAIFLPKPKFKIKAKTKKSNGKDSSTDLPSLAGHDNHQGAPSRVLGHVPVVGDDTHNMVEFGVQRLSDVQRGSTSRRRSYAYDDLSLLSLDRVLEEGDKLEKDRMKWQAQAVKSLGNRHARTVSRSRSKSLTQAGRKMRSIPQQQQYRYHHTRGQQSSIDYLAARACLGDQDIIPLGDEEDDTLVVNIGPTPTTVRRPQFDFPKYNSKERHERMPSGSSGLATSSGGYRSSNGLSAQSGSDGQHHHKRNDSWSRSAVRIAKSLPQICGVVKDDDDDVDDVDHQNNKRIQHQPQSQQLPRPERSLEVNNALTPDTLLNPIVGDNNEIRKPSPSPSNTSGGVLVGIAISTPPDPGYRDYNHPYTIGADRGVEESKRKEEDSSGRSPPDIRLPDHPYAQGGLSSSSISRCVAGEREPDYVGPHPAVAVAMTKELMADLGLSELSARHRLPPQVMLAPHQPPPPPLIRLESGSQDTQVQPLPPLQEQEQQTQPQPQKQKSSNQLYVKVDDTRNSYQDLQPYVRVDSNAQPSDRLWVTYSPGTVREVMPNEVFEYSPRVSDKNVAHVATAATASTSGPDPSPVSASGEGTDFFLQRYQRMSTVYQDTAAMSQALGDAMYDSSSTQDAMRRGRKRSVDSGTRNSEERQQSSTPSTTSQPHLPDTNASQEEQLITLRYQPTPPPRILFGPRLNTTPPKDLGSNLSASRVSSPILPRASPIVFTDPFPGRGRGGRLVASPENSSSGMSNSTPTSPTVPRVGSPDNLEPFHGLFYRPPEGSESDSPIPSPSPLLGRVSGPEEEDEEEEPSHLLLDDDAQWIPRPRGSGMTTLMKEVDDELEQMVLERKREEQMERSDSLRSSNTLQSLRPSTEESRSISTTSKGGSGEGGGGRRSRRINTEAGPLDFVLDRSTLPQQDATTTAQSGYVPRPNRISTFYPATPIPEDIEFSRASSPFEGTVEDETVRLQAGSNTSNPNNNAANQTTTMVSTSYTPAPLPRPTTYPTEEEYMSMNYPDGLRASYLTTTDTNSRISTLSDFPVPPKGMTPEEISILTAQPR